MTIVSASKLSVSFSDITDSTADSFCVQTVQFNGGRQYQLVISQSSEERPEPTVISMSEFDGKWNYGG
jgi:hypothetical protein